MIKYYCPDFYFGASVYSKIIEWKKKYPEYFKEFEISAIFGSFPNMIWNGGSTIVTQKAFPALVDWTKDLYAELNIPLQITCTNSSLQSYHLSDEYCNMILEKLESPTNHVLVSTDLMYDYISKYYPQYKIDRSIVNTGEDYDWNEGLKKYNNIVLPRRHCYDMNWLENTFKPEVRERVEILCNDPCPINCPYINTHYKKFERLTLQGGPDIENACGCENTYLNQLLIQEDYRYIIKYSDIKEKYEPLGFTSMKLAGRGSKQKIMDAIIPYFVKDEFQVKIYSQLIKEVGL